MASNVVPLQNQADASAFMEIGRSGLSRFGGLIHEEFLPILRGRRGIRIFEEMAKNDPVLGASLKAYTQTIRSSTWFVKDGGEDSQRGREAKDFLQSCTDDMTKTFDETISEGLTHLKYGWAWMELVYKVRKGESRNPRLNSQYNDGGVGWRKIALRKQSSFLEWQFDENSDEIEAFVQQAPPDYKTRVIPLSKSLLFRTLVEGNNPEGESVFRTAYRPWYIKKNIEELEAIGVERDLVGLPKVIPPESFNIKAKENIPIVRAVEQLLYSLRRDEQDGIFLPPGWELELLGGGQQTRRQFDVDKIITRYDKRCALSMLTHAIMLGIDRVGSFALSKSQVGDFFQVSVQGFLNGMSEVFNRFAVPALFAMNPKFDGLRKAGKLPYFVPGQVTAPSIEELGAFIKDVTGAGFLIADTDVADYLKRAGGFSEPRLRRVQTTGDQQQASATEPPEPKPAEPKSTEPKPPKPQEDPDAARRQPVAAHDRDEFDAIKGTMFRVSMEE